MKLISSIIVLLACLTVNAQESIKMQDTTKVKAITHELGFNTVALIKQMISNNPSSTLPQLPYALFYNLYYKNMIGLRLGVGISNSKITTSVVGQAQDKVTKINTNNIRAGISYNFIRTKRFTCNVFGDYVHAQNNTSTVNTSTVQTFPNPVSTIGVTSKDNTSGNGGELGFGLKYKILKHLSVYAEIPVVFLASKTVSQTVINDGGSVDITSSKINNNSTQIILPTTLYLVLTF